MANVTIVEFKGVGSVSPGVDDSSFRVPAAAPLSDGTQIEQPQMTAAGQSQAFGTKTRMIRVHTDAIIKISVGGTNPSATANSARMAANQTEYFCVNPGDKLSWITSA